MRVARDDNLACNRQLLCLLFELWARPHQLPPEYQHIDKQLAWNQFELDRPALFQSLASLAATYTSSFILALVLVITPMATHG